MKHAISVMHLNMVRRFPGVLSWVPRRRRRQVRGADESGPDTLVLARNEGTYLAWLGQNVPVGERSRYAYLASVEDLRDFRGTVLLRPGGWSRQDIVELLDVIEPCVHSGRMAWAA